MSEEVSIVLERCNSMPEEVSIVLRECKTGVEDKNQHKNPSSINRFISELYAGFSPFPV